MRSLKEIKDTISKGMTWLKAKYADKTKWIIKSKKVPLIMIILTSEVEMIVEVEIKVEDIPTYFPSCNFLFLSFF